MSLPNQLHICMMSRAVVQHQTGGGMEMHAEVLRRGFVERGHRLTVITTPHLRGAVRLDDTWGKTLFVGHDMPVTYTRDWWREGLKALLDLHAHDPIDVIASQGKAAFAYLGVRSRLPVTERIPTVVISHNTIMNDFQAQLAQLSRRPDRVARWLPRGIVYFLDDRRRLHLADGVTVLSEEHARSMQRWSAVEPRRITVIPNGVDSVALTAGAPLRGLYRQQLGITDDDVRIVLVLARLAPEKGQQFLLESLVHPEMQAHSRDVHVVLAGEGPARDSLMAQTRSLGLQDIVTFLGRVPHDEVPGLLAAADIVALPSVAEGMPLSLLEAMACGLPVIASDIRAIASFIEDSVTGRLVPVAQPAALARVLAQFVTDQQYAADMGGRARASVIAHYDQRSMVAAFERVLIKTALGGEKSGGTTPEEGTQRMGESMVR